MSSQPLHPDEYELVNRASIESNDSFDLDDADFESNTLTKSRSYQHRPNLLDWLLSKLPPNIRRRLHVPTSPRNWLRTPERSRASTHRPLLRRIALVLHISVVVLVTLIAFTGLFRPSYNKPPTHYETLRDQAAIWSKSGRVNLNNEKVFIAASIYDKGGKLARGDWAKNIISLIELLGENNVFLSIYENDAGPEATAALGELKERVKCPHELVSEAHLSLEDIPHITLPDGSERVKRISYLAEVRNRALRPLDDPLRPVFDKLLYVNDVVFDPVDAAQLLFSTNAGPSGKANYRAACAVDFINPFKFYDTFATRDLEGFGMGVPFFPWFSNAGRSISRQEVLEQSDAVRVRSCWGGMVAFDAKYFQHRPDPSAEEVVRFRAEKDVFWDASECCLIHADIQTPPDTFNLTYSHTGIYMNPYVRVAYDTTTLRWLSVTRRFERLYSIPHNILNHLVGLPWHNPRRTEAYREEVQEEVYAGVGQGKGYFRMVDRLAGTGGFCGRRGLQVMKVDTSSGGKPYEEIIPPPEA